MDIAELALVYNIGGASYNRQASSTLKFLVAAAGDTDATRTAMAQAAYDAWDAAGGAMIDVLPASSELDHVECWKSTLEVNPDYVPGPPEVGMPYRIRRLTVPVQSTGAPIPGVDTGDAYPPNVAWVVTLRTVKAGRAYRGRAYLPPISQTRGGIDGETTQGFADDVAADFAKVIVAVEAAAPLVDIDHVIATTRFGTTEEVTQYTCSFRVDTQRRRLRREQ